MVKFNITCHISVWTQHLRYSLSQRRKEKKEERGEKKGERRKEKKKEKEWNKEKNKKKGEQEDDKGVAWRKGAEMVFVWFKSVHKHCQ